jgi:hypothetical protein
MRSIFGTPIGWRPTRPLVGYAGSITAINFAHGTTRFISARNFSRRVRFFFKANSALAKLRWLMVGVAAVFMTLGMHGACLTLRIDQRFPWTLMAARFWVAIAPGEVPPISRIRFLSIRSSRCQPPSRQFRQRFVSRWSNGCAQVAVSTTWPESSAATPAASTHE